MILITSQQLAFADFIDVDQDGFQYVGSSYDPQVSPDCDQDDNNPCIPDVNTTACKGSKDPIGEINDVKNELNDLIESGDFNINSAQVQSLLTKLQQASAKVDSGNITSAIGKLNSFINQINAFYNSGTISSGNRDLLTGHVQEIINNLQ